MFGYCGESPIPPVGEFFQEYSCELWKCKYINVDFFIKHFTVKIIQVQKKKKKEKKMIVEGILNYFLYYFLQPHSWQRDPLYLVLSFLTLSLLNFYKSPS